MSIPDQMARAAVRLLTHGVQDYAGRALRLAQRSAARAALGIETAQPRLATLTEAGLRVTEASCRCVDRLVRQSVASAHGALEDGTERLRMTARARSLSALYDEQRATLPASRERISRELETVWKIVASARRDLAEIAHSTREQLLGQPRPKRGRRKRSAGSRRSGRAAPPAH